MGSNCYILDGHTPKTVGNLDAWSRWMATADRHVRHTTLGALWVSTVFLGIDHNFFDDGPPILFETMVFGDGIDSYQTRCATWEEAELNHAEAVEMATARMRAVEELLPAVRQLWPDVRIETRPAGPGDNGEQKDGGDHDADGQ